MADSTAIEWADATWNPVTGCTKISKGCDNCYAERLAERFRSVPGHPFEHGFDLALQPHRLGQPARWRRPRRVFVNSMSDLFHKHIPVAYIDRVFEAMEEAPQHVYQLLTKRSSRMRNYLARRYGGQDIPANIWCGVSVEDAAATVRIGHLRDTPVHTRFISFEPLLGPVSDVDLSGIGWVIVGGESGPQARPMASHWAIEIRDMCAAQAIPFFLKQWGGRTPRSGGRELEGKIHDAVPALVGRDGP